ncbi:MAG: F0F1 ATP synthase subunit A [Actinobacteria bacterium]|nr:F0F1 ATP synthase subunit A [Actinomycetota bacterium]
MEILEEFYLKIYVPIKIFGIDVSITNLVVWMFIATTGIFLALSLLSRNLKVLPDKKQTFAEFLYHFIDRSIIGMAIGKGGERWLPFLGTIFIFIFANNLIGLIPHSYTPTSNPVVPATLAIIVFFTVHITNIKKNGLIGYLRSFVPRGVPIWMLPLVIPIEVISSIARPFSLLVRLTANMLAGHIVILVLISLILLFKSYLIAIPVLPFTVILYLFELFVAGLQAYIFTILSAVYIGEAIHPRH